MIIPHWLNRAAFEKQVREEFLAHLHTHAPAWRGNYNAAEGLFTLQDLREEESKRLSDVKLNPHKIYVATSSAWGLKARREVYDFWLAQLNQMAADSSDEATLETHGASVLPRLVDPEFISQIESQTEMPQRAWGWTGFANRLCLRPAGFRGVHRAQHGGESRTQRPGTARIGTH